MPPSPKPQNIESYAEALEVHLSNLNTRLAATLDALDELTRNHELEVVRLHNQARYLRAKCQVSKSRAKEAEAERDELKADVNKLVEKVEIANDHRVLPHSRMHLPRPLDPLPSQLTIRLEEDVHRDAYFPAILNNLKAELKAERYAFSELQQVSEARIATLEAQVARREAELYAYKPCSCRSSANLEPSVPLAHKTKLQPAGTTLSKAQYALIEKETAMRQRTLEIEIDGLRRKLQSAQAEAFGPKLPLRAPQGLREPGARPQDSPSSRSTTHHIQPDPTTHPVLSDINRQLSRINIEVDNLQAEQDNVKAEVDKGREDDGRYPDNLRDKNFRGVLLIEEECIRLRESERSLRRELLLATAAASATEHSLQSLVNKLQRQLRMLRNPDTSGISSHDDMHSEDELLNDVASEHTMTARLDSEVSCLTPPLRFSTPAIQLSPVPLPLGISNDDHDFHQSPTCDRPPSAPPFFHHTQAQRHSTTRLTQIESELNQAHRDVWEKDQAITTLRAQLGELQKVAQARTLRERGGPWHGSGGEKNG